MLWVLSLEGRRYRFQIILLKALGGSSNKDFCSFLDRSIKSTPETVNILYFAEIRRYINEEKRLELYKEAERLIRKMRAFKKSL
jgi:four helix bundle protein